MNKELGYAYELLKNIYFKESYSSIELNKLLTLKKNENINFALITKIVYGVLEKDILLSYAVNNFVKKEPEGNIYLLLKMATYVNRFTDSIPNYALINECVNLAKKENRYASGFVNATLKNITSSKVTLPDKNKDYVNYLSVKYSYPKWIIEQLLKENKKQFVEDYLSAELTTLTHVRVVNPNFNETSGFNKGKLTADFQKIADKFVKDLNDNKIEYKETCLPFTFYVDYNKLLKNDLFNGRYIVQGLPSVIVSLNMNVKSGENVLDCTGAPGGKSALMAELESKSTIMCCDIHAHRVELIKSFMKKCGINNVTANLLDATKYNENYFEKFEKILCDVPCSGIGVVNKKPDILLNKTLKDVKTLSGVQFNILTNNSKYLKQGGTLVYSTCSIMTQENEKVIEKFLSQNKNFVCEPINTFGVEVVNKNNMYTFYPNISKTEGFFIAKLKRIK